jgi:hypothetical protein
MKNHKKNVAFLTLFVIVLFILLSSCNEPTDLRSKWRVKDIVIDATDNEWQDYQLYTDLKTQTKIGVCNDDSYVYICFSTMDTEIQKAIVRQGFVIWFNETGGKNKALGVRYPIGGQPSGQGAPAGGGPGNSIYTVKELQILTSEKDAGKTLKVSEAAELDINVRIATDQSDRLIYELKMPLRKTDKAAYAVVPSQLNKIGVGVMTVKAPGINTGGKSGFGGSISEIGGSSGGASDSIKSSDMGGIMENRYVDEDDPDLGKVSVVHTTARGAGYKSIEIWSAVLLASRP